METGFSSSCYIFKTPIDEDEELSETNKQVEIITKENTVNGVVTSEQPNNSVPSITITITGNTNNAELLQSTVMTEILKSLEFSKLQTNNDENDNLNSSDEVDEKHCEESIDENSFSVINVNEIQQNYIKEKYARESFSSAFSEQRDDDSSNDELSDVPKETDLLFEDIVGKLMVPKHNEENTSKKKMVEFSEADKEPLSKSLETLSYDDLIKYNDSQLDFFQDQCEFDSDDPLRRLEEIRFKIPTPDNSSENADSFDAMITEKSKNSPNIQVTKISNEIILFDYTKIKKESFLSRDTVEESRLEPSPVNVNIQDMQVVFDVPVEPESNQIKRHLQNTLNSNVIEFFVIPNDDEDDSLGSGKKSPKQVDFSEVAKVPAVLELIGATCEVKTNNDESRLLENDLAKLDNDEIKDDYSNR